MSGTNLAFRVNDNLKSLLNQLARQKKITKTSIIEEALSDYFQKQNAISEHTGNTQEQDETLQEHTENTQEQEEALQEDEAIKQTMNDIEAGTNANSSEELSGIIDTDTDKAKQIGGLAMLGGAVWLMCRRYNFNKG